MAPVPNATFICPQNLSILPLAFCDMHFCYFYVVGGDGTSDVEAKQWPCLGVLGNMLRRLSPFFHFAIFRTSEVTIFADQQAEAQGSETKSVRLLLCIPFLELTILKNDATVNKVPCDLWSKSDTNLVSMKLYSSSIYLPSANHNLTIVVSASYSFPLWDLLHLYNQRTTLCNTARLLNLLGTADFSSRSIFSV